MGLRGPRHGPRLCFECWGRGWISGCGQSARAPAHSSAPPVAAENSATTCKQAGHSAAEACRDPGAVSAASQSAAARIDALPVEAVHVVDVLALAPQLGCAEIGRSASIDALRSETMTHDCHMKRSSPQAHPGRTETMKCSICQ